MAGTPECWSERILGLSQISGAAIIDRPFRTSHGRDKFGIPDDLCYVNEQDD